LATVMINGGVHVNVAIAIGCMDIIGSGEVDDL
jgi:hypothetical protein